MNNDEYSKNYRKIKKYLEWYEGRHAHCFGTPLVFSFLVTNRCNLRCKHCFYHETIEQGCRSEEITLDEYRMISSGMDNFMTGIFCGGEPFIREDFYEIINIFQTNNNLLLADSASNGQNTGNILMQVEKILKNSPHQGYSLGISIDGFEEIHDCIRGKGSYEKAVRTYNELQKMKKYYSNFELYICTTINTLNEKSLSLFVENAIKKMKPSKVSLIKTRQHPREGEEIKEIKLCNYLKCIQVLEESMQRGDKKELAKPQSYLLQSINNYIYDGEVLGEKKFHCYAGVHGAFMDYNGDVGVCEIMPKIGNIREYGFDFKQLWNSKKALELRKQVNIREECKKCTHESEGLLPSLYFAPNEMKYERI